MEPEVITVGLDGSPESLAAAHWAADEADRRQWALRLLHAWILPAAGAPQAPADRDRNDGAREVVRRARDEVRERHPGCGSSRTWWGGGRTGAFGCGRRFADGRARIAGARAVGELCAR
ncbi:universal stress protein [Streptomyces lydicus]|nr:universal stress protein [Streptomyces lydicus]